MHALRSYTPMAVRAAVAAGLLLTIASTAPAGAIPVAAGTVPAPAGTQQAISVSDTGPVRTVTPALLGLNAVNVTGPRWNQPVCQSQ